MYQDTQRISERRDMLLQSEYALVQGGRRFSVVPPRMHVHEIPFPPIKPAASYAAGCLLLLFQNTTTRPGGVGPNDPYLGAIR